MSFDAAEEIARQHFASGRYREAIAELERLAAASPRHAAYPSNLSYLWFLLGDCQRAVAQGRLATSLDPAFAPAYLNLGNALQGNGDTAEALATFNHGIALDAGSAPMWTGLGLVDYQAGALAEARRCHEQAIRLDARLPEAHCNLGLCLLDTMQAETAARHFRLALDINPRYRPALSNYLMSLQYLPGRDAGAVHEAAALVKNCFADLKPAPVAEARTRASGELRVGFVSHDFCRHPVGYFLAGLFALPRRPGYTFYCYANHSREDELTRMFKNSADHWREIRSLSDQQAADLVRADGIDVLVDLAGHTTGNRLGVFVLRPAPCQVSWLGFFASTGLETMDYALLARDQAIEGTQDLYTERLQLLDCCQFNYVPELRVSAAPGLPSERNGYLTFGCFNNPAKLNGEVLGTWARIMEQLPQSRLVLKWKSYGDRETAAQLLSHCAAWGLSPQRVELRPASSYPELLQQYGDIDIALDPFPFSGAMTTCEALSMGVPVVTLRQLRPVSRQSHAILCSVGLEKLSATTPRSYRALVLELASNAPERRRLRSELPQRMVDASRVNCTKLAENLEIFFRAQVR